MVNSRGGFWRRDKSLLIQVAVTLIRQSVTANTVLTIARIFAGSINCKWLALTAFTLRERRGGKGRAGVVSSEQAVIGWLSCVDRKMAVVSYLSPLFGLHALRVQHDHWEERRRRGKQRADEHNVIKQSQSSILLLQTPFVLFPLCWHSSFIILPRLDDIMKCQARWGCTALKFYRCDVHMQRTEALKQDWMLREHNLI